MLGICGISRLHRHVTGMAIKQKSGNVAFGVAIVGQASLEACPFCFADLLRFGDQFVPETKTESFCNFFAIADSLLSLQSGNKPLCSRFAAFWPSIRDWGLRAIPNRKKVAILVAILFLVLGLLRNDAEAG